MPSTDPERYTAIPLVRYKSKPGSRVIVFFTLEGGIIRTHARKPSSKKGGTDGGPSLFSTFDLFLAPPRRGSKLYELRERRLRTSRPGLNSGKPLDSWAAASVLAELLLKTMGDGEPHPYLFSMMEKALDHLEGEGSPTPLLVAFLVKHVEHMGFRPRLDRCICGKATDPGVSVRFDLPRGGVCCSSCLETREDRGDLRGRTGFVLNPRMRDTLENFRLVRFESLHQTCLDERTGEALIDLLGAYVEYHFEIFLKSLGFWRRVHNTRESGSP